MAWPKLMQNFVRTFQSGWKTLFASSRKKPLNMQVPKKSIPVKVLCCSIHSLLAHACPLNSFLDSFVQGPLALCTVDTCDLRFHPLLEFCPGSITTTTSTTTTSISISIIIIISISISIIILILILIPNLNTNQFNKSKKTLVGQNLTSPSLVVTRKTAPSAWPLGMSGTPGTPGTPALYSLAKAILILRKAWKSCSQIIHTNWAISKWCILHLWRVVGFAIFLSCCLWLPCC